MGCGCETEGGDERTSNLDQVSKLIFDHVGCSTPGLFCVREGPRIVRDLPVVAMLTFDFAASLIIPKGLNDGHHAELPYLKTGGGGVLAPIIGFWETQGRRVLSLVI